VLEANGIDIVRQERRIVLGTCTTVAIVREVLGLGDIEEPACWSQSIGRSFWGLLMRVAAKVAA
jgi:hypothetical protein